MRKIQNNQRKSHQKRSRKSEIPRKNSEDREREKKVKKQE